MGGQTHQPITTPHVLLLPLPLQGPISCFLNLAQLLSGTGAGADIHVTFLNALFVHRRLSNHLTSRFLRYPNFRFSVVSDGISGEDPRPAGQVASMVSAVEAEAIRRLPEFAMEEEESPAVTCLIADGIFTEVGKAAMKLGIPVVYFSTLNPSCVWVSSYLVPKLVHDGYVPFKQGDDMDEHVTDIPGTDTFLRRRDLPGICRAHDMSDLYNQLILRECRELPNAQGHIFNTFDDLEGPLLPHLHSLCPNLYTIGPLHSHLKSRLNLELGHESEAEPEPEPQSSSSLWPEDRTCLAWLDAQPSKSVVFVSIGSIIVMTIDQFMEFWHGLVRSGVRFLWVRRHGSVSGLTDEDVGRIQVPEEVLDGTKERGFVVRWAPQEEVLAHPAVGGFLTHSGWNSTLESIVEGVPMICWPIGIDQLVISRFVAEVWQIGVDMKDTCDRTIIEAMARGLINRRDEYSGNTHLLSTMAREAVEKDGSSWRALDRLIEDIRFMRLQVSNGRS